MNPLLLLCLLAAVALLAALPADAVAAVPRPARVEQGILETKAARKTLRAARGQILGQSKPQRKANTVHVDGVHVDAELYLRVKALIKAKAKAQIVAYKNAMAKAKYTPSRGDLTLLKLQAKSDAAALLTQFFAFYKEAIGPRYDDLNAENTVQHMVDWIDDRGNADFEKFTAYFKNNYAHKFGKTHSYSHTQSGATRDDPEPAYEFAEPAPQVQDRETVFPMPLDNDPLAAAEPKATNFAAPGPHTDAGDAAAAKIAAAAAQVSVTRPMNPTNVGDASLNPRLDDIP